MQDLVANQKQKLSEHLKNVAILSEELVKFLNVKENEEYDLIKIAYYSGLLHDIGKTDPIFQKYIHDKNTTDFIPNGVHIEKTKFSFEDHPRHNELSWIILKEILTRRAFNLKPSEINIIKNIVLWHHSAPIRTESFSTSKIISNYKNDNALFNEWKSNFYQLVKELNIEEEFEKFEDILALEDNEITKFKQKYSEKDYKNKSLNIIINDINVESITSLIRAIVITADRYISSQENNINIKKIISTIKEQNIYSELKNEITNMENTFFPNSDRSILQKNAANELSLIKGVSILNAPAGAGKTKTALQWAKNTNVNKLYYIAPRTIICEEIYSELKEKYLPKNVSFELLTGDKKIKWTGKKEIDLEENNVYFDSDIIITTIDQIIKTVTTHSNVNILFDILKSHIIFDEYHEYYKMSGMDLLFAEIINIKSNLINSNTLIMSATPNYFFLEKLLKIYLQKSSENPIVNFETINKKEYLLKYENYYEYDASSLGLFKENNGHLELIMNESLNDIKEINNNPFLRKINDNKKTLIISNTATLSQISFIINGEKENSLLAHSKYKKEDKKDILKNIKNSFKSLNENGANILRSGPIVQASLNITSDRIISEISNPENTLQRLGRLNRFSDNICGEYILAIPHQVYNNESKIGKSNVLNLLSLNNEKTTTLLWINYLKEKLMENKSEIKFYLKDIYNIYNDFYKKEKHEEALETELLNSLHNSYKNISFNILDPIEIPNNKNINKKENVLSKNSLRGDSYFVKMACYKQTNGKFILLEDYVEPVVLPRHDILLYNENYLLVKNTVKNYEYLNPKISKKDISFIKKVKKENSDKYFKYFLNKTKKEEFLINTSFSKIDLQKINKSKNIEESIVYIKSDNQSIGYIKLNKLIKGDKNGKN